MCLHTRFEEFPVVKLHELCEVSGTDDFAHCRCELLVKHALDELHTHVLDMCILYEPDVYAS
jgi:hypothetical protein